MHPLFYGARKGGVADMSIRPIPCDGGRCVRQQQWLHREAGRDNMGIFVRQSAVGDPALYWYDAALLVRVERKCQTARGLGASGVKHCALTITLNSGGL